MHKKSEIKYEKHETKLAQKIVKLAKQIEKGNKKEIHRMKKHRSHKK